MSEYLVAVDGTPLQEPVLGGVGRHLANVLPLVAATRELVVLTDARLREPDVSLPIEQVRVPRGVPRLGWLELGVNRWLSRHPALFYGSFYAIPLRYRGAAVTAFHDVSWETHGEDQPPAKRWLWRRYGRAAAKHSAAFVTVSEFSKQQIVDVYGVDPETVHIAPNAVDPAFIANGRASVALPSGVRRPYIATIGGAPRRGLAEAIGAWRMARSTVNSGLELVVLGPERPDPEPGLHAVGRLDDGEWAAVLAGAEAFVYATRFEGYGVPALEALHCGTPVVCARVGALPEVLGEGAAWAEAPTAEQLGRRLTELLADEDGRRALISRGRAVAETAPTWQASVDAHLAAFDMAWARRGRARD